MWEAEILTMGGGGAEVIYLNWCWGGGECFLGGSNSSLKIKLKPLRSGKIFVTRGSRKNCYGGGGKPNNAPPCRKRDPPPPHTEKIAWPPRTWREKSTAHIKNTPIRETPPTWIFFIHAPPTWRVPISPPCVRRSWSPLTLFRLFERVRKKINKN